MDTNQIKREIEEARERISETTTQIGERIRSRFDWRQHVAEHPWAAVGVAIAAGFFVGAVTSRAFGLGYRRPGRGYDDQPTYDRISRDVEARSEATSAGHSAALGERRTLTGRAAGRFSRAGAATGGLMASMAAVLAPQLQEVGRSLADQLKEYLRERADRWRGRGPRSGEAGRASGGRAGAGSGWPAAGGTTVSSESASSWPTGSRAGGGTESGSGAAGTSGSQANVAHGAGSGYGTRETRTPQSRERESGG